MARHHYPKRSPVAYHRDQFWAPYYFCCNYINDPANCLDKTTPCLYADDTPIFLAVTDLNENLNRDMRKLTEGLNRNKSQHHPTKTKLIGSRQKLKTNNCDSSIMIKN